MRAPFPDQCFLGAPGRVSPVDVRFDPSRAAHLHREGDEVVFRLQTEPGFAEVHLVLSDAWSAALDRVGQSTRFEFWEARIAPPRDRFAYSFALRRDGGDCHYLCPAGLTIAIDRLDRWQLEVAAVPCIDVPAWARGAVLYHVFPDRFCNGRPALSPADVVPWGSPPTARGFQGGDLPGIGDRIDHLVDLGVDVVLLNPIFRSPSTHRFDTVDFHSVDPRLGGDAALADLVGLLHRRGIRLVLGASFNHCHPGFFAFRDLIANGASSPYRDWFDVWDFPVRIGWRPGQVDGDTRAALDELHRESGMPLVELAGDGPAVETTYDTYNGVPGMPRIDLSCPAARSYFLAVARRWVAELDIDGWCMDVPRYVDPDFWPELRRAVREVKPDAYLLADVVGDGSPWLQGDAFDAIHDFALREAILDFARDRISGIALADRLLRLAAAAPAGMADVTHALLGGQDVARLRHEVGGRAGRARLATALQFAVPGLVGLYYGDEIGMTGGWDPGCRGAFPWDQPDTWDTAQLERVRGLSRLRRRFACLRRGALRVLGADADGLAIARQLGDERIVAVVRRAGAGPVVLDAAGEPTVVLGAGSARSSGGRLVVELEPGEDAVFVALGG
ncbi:MAG TPA: glycoside hydrolase family 13 protein [Kofleriaceae bacterium]|nr:glycoside hydrolase family 13 protein [Kofleriaceae bacterium]